MFALLEQVTVYNRISFIRRCVRDRSGKPTVAGPPPAPPERGVLAGRRKAMWRGLVTDSPAHRGTPKT